MRPKRIGDVSFWFADMGGLPKQRRALQGNSTADICIIGAGYTGLWTAYYLKKAKPGLDILVVEKEFAGFGASGRNGGWATGGFAWSHEKYLKTASEQNVRAMVRAMGGTVDEIFRIAKAEGIQADLLRTDEMMVATSPAQFARMEAEVQRRRHWGEKDRVWQIGAQEAKARVNIPGTLGGMVVGGVARVQPAKLVRGLAEVVERMGVRIVEGTAVTAFEKGVVNTTYGRIKAGIILRATEGFTATLPGLKRQWLPLNSAQIVTAPVPETIWAKIGWQGHELIGDFRNAYCYCQRTREGRITVGARGVPYKFGSQIDRRGEPDLTSVQRLVEILHRHFPDMRELNIDHAWCGVLAVPRDWCASVGFDRASGIGFAGGYVGVGVSTSNLAARTLADLALYIDSELTVLPWVNRKVRRWEAEPLRWLGMHAMYGMYNIADNRETRLGGPPSRFAALANKITGR